MYAECTWHHRAAVLTLGNKVVLFALTLGNTVVLFVLTLGNTVVLFVLTLGNKVVELVKTWAAPRLCGTLRQRAELSVSWPHVSC